MAGFKTSDKGTEEVLGLSLNKAVEDVSHHSTIQTEALKEKQKILSSLQANLTDVERRSEVVEQQLKTTVREILLLEISMEDLEQHTKCLHDRCVSISKENTELKIHVHGEEEKAHVALVKFTDYRTKMESHRAAVLHMMSQTEVFKNIEEKRALVRNLKLWKDELKKDLESSDGKTVCTAQRENDALKEKICLMKKAVAKKTELLQKELETQTGMKKEIEIQNKRYEAIVKRLNCQLSRAQAVHRQVSEKICNMQIQLAELKKQYELSQNSVGGGN